jgi:hypothetical protein
VRLARNNRHSSLTTAHDLSSGTGPEEPYGVAGSTLTRLVHAAMVSEYAFT